MICWLTNSINGTRSLHFAYPTHRVAAIQARTSYAQVGCLLRFTFSGHTRHRQSTNYRLDVTPRVHTLSIPCPQQCLICFSSSSSSCYRLLSNFGFAFGNRWWLCIGVHMAIIGLGLALWTPLPSILFNALVEDRSPPIPGMNEMAVCRRCGGGDGDQQWVGMMVHRIQ